MATSLSDRRLSIVLSSRAHIVERYPELVDLEAGRNVRVDLRIDVGVDAQRHARYESQPRRDRFDAGQFPNRLDVDRLEPDRHGALELGGRFADAGEDNISGGKARFAGQLDLPRSSWRRRRSRARRACARDRAWSWP